MGGGSSLTSIVSGEGKTSGRSFRNDQAPSTTLIYINILLNRIFYIHNSIHSFLLGLLGSLIPIDTLAFVPQRQSSIVTRLRRFATPQVSRYCYTPLVVFVTPLDSSIVI